MSSIGAWAFAYCSSLTSFEIPSGVASIEDCVFEDCEKLTSIEIPSGVTRNAFTRVNLKKTGLRIVAL
jgi:hypothetical protein